MRILHTADWHLGRLLHQVSLLDEQRHALDQILHALQQHAVDALVIAGDVYDRAVPPAEAVELLDGFLDRVAALGVPVLMIGGNHDSLTRLGFGARQLAAAGIHIFAPSAQPQPVLLADAHGEVAFYGFPYLEPVQLRELSGESLRSHDQAAAYLCERALADNPAGRRCVAIAHCFVSGGAVCDSERPLSVGGSEQVGAEHFLGFHYAALGHLHQPQQQGAPHVRYSGSLGKYSFSEAGHRKSLTLVELDADGGCQIELLPLQPRRDLRVLRGTLQALLAQAVDDPCRDDYLLVRLDDEQALLDVMGRLRAVYPNVLQIERPGLLNRAVERVESARALEREELPLFADFFEQMRGEALDDAQRAALVEALESLRRSER